MLSALAQPDNAAQLGAARDKAGTDMLKHMQHVFPLATQMQMSVLPKHGFPSDAEGAWLGTVRLCDLFQTVDGAVGGDSTQ